MEVAESVDPSKPSLKIALAAYSKRVRYFTLTNSKTPNTNTNLRSSLEVKNYSLTAVLSPNPDKQGGGHASHGGY
jgi:hypothetical protein